MLPTGEMLNMLNLKGLPTKNVLKTGEMLKMPKMLKVFWVLTLFISKFASHSVLFFKRCLGLQSQALFGSFSPAT